MAIVGYTNAGKSSLLNRLTSATVAVEDRLFATVDPTTRRLGLPGGETVFLTDTVGFVRKLPHQLVEAFKTTLDVVRDADLLVHVVDSADSDPDGSMAAVRKVLVEIEADEVPELVVYNKSDLGPAAARLAERSEGSVAVSAATGEGVDELLGAIGDRMRRVGSEVELVVPWDRGDVLAGVHRRGPGARIHRHRARDEGQGPPGASLGGSPAPLRGQRRGPRVSPDRHAARSWDGVNSMVDGRHDR